MKKIQIIIPLYNEHNNFLLFLSDLQNNLAKLRYEYEIILVDDGSTDDTWENIRNVAKKESNIIGVKLFQNTGKDGAIKEALRQFDADASIIMDGDGQHPAQSISDLLSQWENGSKIVCALKASRKDDSKFQIFTSWMFNIFMSKLIGKELAGSSDFMLIDRIIAKAISNRQANATLIRFDVLNFGFNPKRVYFDVQETSRATRWTLASKMKLAMRALLFNTSIAERLLLLFVSLSMIFLFSIVAIVVLAWFFFGAPQGYPTLIILQIFCLLLNMLSFSILAVYLKNIFDLASEKNHNTLTISTKDE